MAKSPSEKRKPARKKIPSSKFPKAKRKIASGKFADETSKLPSSKFVKTKKVKTPTSTEDAPLERPIDEQSRQDALAILKERAAGMRTAGKKRKE
ncbi:MAG: hypothetical protein O2945_22930 [Planctomycetota bacterium]|nr:hypothetical protein [Planctomycetota bacterium]